MTVIDVAKDCLRRLYSGFSAGRSRPHGRDQASARARRAAGERGGRNEAAARGAANRAAFSFREQVATPEVSSPIVMEWDTFTASVLSPGALGPLFMKEAAH